MGFLNNIFGGIGKAVGNLFGGGGGAGGGFNPMSMFGMGGGTPGAKGQTSYGQMNPGMMGLGLGIQGLGQLMNKQTKMPDFNSMPQIQALQNFTTNPPQLPANMQTEIQNTLKQSNDIRRRQLMGTYQTMKPGFNPQTDSDFIRDSAILERNIASDNANAMISPTLQYQQPLLQGLESQAQLGVGQGMGQAALNAQRQAQRNQIFGNVGNMFMMRGMGFPYYMNNFNLGQS